MPSVPYPFPYQGSKRTLAPIILSYLPQNTGRLLEPFAGSGAVSLAAVAANRAQKCVLNDLNAPLIALWKRIVEQPVQLAADYRAIWQAQDGREKALYNEVRERFNRTHQPSDFLFLLVRCVKAAVRYNDKGEFNQSADNRRKGTHPDTITTQIAQISVLFEKRVIFSDCDYRIFLRRARPSDVVYLDPPYQGVSDGRDGRYLAGVGYDELVETLRNLNRRRIPYLLSYDGKTGAKTFGKPLPAHLQLERIEIDAGRSSQATLLGKDARTCESLYLSPALITRITSLPIPLEVPAPLRIA